MKQEPFSLASTEYVDGRSISQLRRLFITDSYKAPPVASRDIRNLIIITKYVNLQIFRWE